MVVFIGVKIFSKISSLSRLLMGRLDPINFELEVSCHCSNVQFKHELPSELIFNVSSAEYPCQSLCMMISFVLRLFIKKPCLILRCLYCTLYQIVNYNNIAYKRNRIISTFPGLLILLTLFMLDFLNGGYQKLRG